MFTYDLELRIAPLLPTMSVEPNPYDLSGVSAEPQSDELRFGVRYAPILFVSLSNCFLQFLERLGDEGTGIMVGYYLGQTSVISLWVAWGTGSFRRRVCLATIAGACLSLGAWLPSLLAEGATAITVDGTQTLAYIIVPLCCVCIATTGLTILRRYGNWRLTERLASTESDPDRPNAIHFVALSVFAGLMYCLWFLSPAGSEGFEYFFFTVSSSFVLSLLSLSYSCFGALIMLRRPNGRYAVPLLILTVCAFSFVLARMFPGMAPGASGVVYPYAGSFALGSVALLLTSMSMLFLRATGIELYSDSR